VILQIKTMAMPKASLKVGVKKAWHARSDCVCVRECACLSAGKTVAVHKALLNKAEEYARHTLSNYLCVNA